MKTRIAMVTAGIGAGLMYLLDPQAGKRRRALVRDKARRALHDAGDAIRPAVEDLYNRAYGTVAEARSKLTTAADDAPDSLLVDRVRSEIGLLASHPRAIEVSAYDGRVVLEGDVLGDEEQRVVRAAGGVRGVREVENRLRAHADAASVPALRGGKQRVAHPRLRGSWPPAIRLAATAAGALLTLSGARRRGLGRFVLSGLGTSLFARGVTNVHLRTLMGAHEPEPAIDVHKTLHIDAPVERVFALWTDVANFPYFMRNVREVRDLGNGRSEWTVSGPAGVPVTWTALITDYVPNELLAWRTERGAAVHHAGAVRFERRGGGTRADVRLSYHPVGGAVGHGVATLFGADPKSEMDADLARMKTFLETGKPAHDAAQPESRGDAAMGATAQPGTAAGGTHEPSETVAEDEAHPPFPVNGHNRPRSLH